MKKPNYLNKKIKKVTAEELKKVLKEVNEKNKQYRRQLMEDTSKALFDGFRCGPKT